MFAFLRNALGAKKHATSPEHGDFTCICFEW